MSNTATIYHRDGREQTIDVHEAARLTRGDQDWSFVKPPPIGWEREVPRYRATRGIHPAEKIRFRAESPFTTISDNDAWQYGERPLARGDEIETTSWPHPSFRPLNYSAGRVLAFFNSRIKSRLPRSPWAGDRVRLDDGLTGTVVKHVPPPQFTPMDQRPAS